MGYGNGYGNASSSSSTHRQIVQSFRPVPTVLAIPFYRLLYAITGSYTLLPVSLNLESSRPGSSILS